MPSVTQRLALIILAVIAVAGVARADHSLDKPKSAEAREHLKAGIALYNRAQWQAAADEYRAGAAIEDAPIFDFNLGQCFRFAGDYQQALTHYERFMDRGAPTGKVLDSVQGFVADMRAHLERTRELAPTQPAPTPPIAAAAPTPPPPASAPTTAPSTRWRNLGWGLTAVGVLGGGVSAYLVVDGRNASRDAADVSRPQSDRVRLDDRAASRQKEALIVGIGSGAVLVAGVVTLLVASPSREPRPQTAWNVAITSNGVSLFGQF